MVACVVGCAAEAVWPHAYMPTCVRVSATMAQGALFIIIAHLLFTPRAAWDISEGDQAPFQYAKVRARQISSKVFSGYRLQKGSVDPWGAHASDASELVITLNEDNRYSWIFLP